MSAICRHRGKHIHATRLEARAHLRGLRRRTGYDGDVYPCHFCKGWHVGQPIGKRQKRKK